MPDPLTESRCARGIAATGRWAPADFLEWRKQATAFQELAASWAADFTLTGVDETRRLHGARVTANLFRALTVRPALGREFTAAEGPFGGAQVAILSDAIRSSRRHE